MAPAIPAEQVNEELFERYAIEWHEYHNIDPKRRKQQLFVLHQFAERIAPRSMLEATSQDIRDWVGAKHAQGRKPGTLRLHINYFKPFYTWAFQVGLITTEQRADLRSVKPPRGSNRTVPRPYTSKQMKRFWADFEVRYKWTRAGESRERGAMFLDRYLRGMSRWHRARNYCVRLQAEAIVALALYGGMRRVEIFRCELDDLDPQNEYVVCHSALKGDRELNERDRAVPWTCDAMKVAVENWLFCRQQLAAAKPELFHGGQRPWLWLSPTESRAFLPQREAEFVGTVATCGEWSFGPLRHTAATELLRSGMDLQILSRIMGHTSVARTLMYAQLVEKDIVAGAQAHRAQFGRNMRRRDSEE